jgi:hypothetical protein
MTTFANKNEDILDVMMMYEYKGAPYWMPLFCSLITSQIINFKLQISILNSKSGARGRTL